VGREAVGREAVGREAVGREAVGTEAVGTEAVGTEAVGTEAVGTAAVEKGGGALSPPHSSLPEHPLPAAASANAGLGGSSLDTHAGPPDIGDS
jgi:hypothetical protein